MAASIATGDLEDDGIGSAELNAVLMSYWPYSPWLSTPGSGVSGLSIHSGSNERSATEVLSPPCVRDGQKRNQNISYQNQEHNLNPVSDWSGEVSPLK
jgi:hypothetical protein